MFKKIFKSKWFLPVILSVVLVVTGIVGVFIAGNTDAYFTDNDKGDASGDSGKTGVSFIVGENSFAETLDGVDEIDTMYWAGTGKLNFTIQNNEDIALDAYTTILFTSEDEQDWEAIAPLIELYDQKYVTIENDNYILSDDAVPVKATKEVLDNGIQWTLAKDVISGSDETENGQIRWINSEGNAISNAKYQSLTDQEKAAYTKCEDAKTYDLFFCYHESGGADIRMEVTVHSSTNKEGNQLGWKRSNEFKRYGHLMPRVNILEAGELFNAHLTELAEEEEIKEVVFTASDLSDKAAVEPVATYSLKKSAPAATTMSLRSGGEEEKVLPVCPGVTIPSEGTIDVSHYKNKSILAWNDNGTVYVASVNGDVVYANWDCSEMFDGHAELEKIRFINFDISEYTTDLSNMFSRCTGLVMLDFSGWDMTGITDMGNMFNMVPNYGCNLQAIYVNDTWTTEVVSPDGTLQMGSGLGSVIGQTGTIDGGTTQWGYVSASSFNYENGILVYFDGDPNSLVAGHHFNSLIPSTATELYIGDYHESIPADKSKWIDFSISQDYAVVGWLDGTKLYITSQDGNEINTSGSMYKMFAREGSGKAALTIISIKNVNSADAFNGSHLFYNQTTLANLDIKELDTDNMTSMYMMFYNCDALTELDCTIFNTSSATNMSYMFYSCGSLNRLLVSNFDTSKVTDMSYMFNDCPKLTMLNLSGWDTSNMAKTNYMFGLPVGGGSASTLNTIYVSDKWNTDKMTEYADMFRVTSVLVGQSGTSPYSADGTYANYKTGVLTYYDGSPNALIAGPSFRAAVPNTATAIYIGDYHESIPEDKSTWVDLSISQDYSVVGWLDGTTFYVTSQDGNEINTCGSMYKMFAYESSNHASPTIISLKNINTANVFNFANMFYNQTKLATLDIAEVETPKADNMKNMFYGCSALTELNVNHFDTSNVTNMTYMFYGCSSMTRLLVSELDVSKVTNMSYMFNMCSKLQTLNLSGWDTSSVKDTSYMFGVGNGGGNSVLNTIYVGDKWNTSQATTHSNMFCCTPLVGQSGATVWVGDGTYSNYETGVLTYYNGSVNALVTGPSFNALIPSTATEVYVGDYHTSIPADKSTWIDFSIAQDYSVIGWLDGTKLYITSQDGSEINTCGSMYRMFNNKTALTTVKFANINTANAINMSYMFYNCSALKTVDVSCFDTTRATNMSYMFYNCAVLTELNLSNFNTGNVTNMSYMFANCKALTTLNISSFDTTKVTNMADMFYYCQALTALDLSSWNVSNVTSMYEMFRNCSNMVTLNLANWAPEKVTTMYNMFASCYKLATIYGEDWTGYTNITNSNNMFSGTSALVGAVRYTDTYMYDIQGASYLSGYFTKVSGIHNSLLPGAKFNAAITGTSSIRSVVFTDTVASGFTYTDLSEAQDGSILGWLNGTTYYIASADGGTIYAHPVASGMFRYWSYVNSFDFTNLSFEHTESAERMFQYCSAITDTTVLEISLLKAKTIKEMFSGVYGFAGTVDAPVVTDASMLFSGCQNATVIDISGLNIPKVENISRMFAECRKVTSIDVSTLNTSNVTNMSYMFYNAYVLTDINFGEFDTSKVTDMSYMFYSCKALTELDASNFDMSSVTNTSYMFGECTKLVTIYAGDWTDVVTPTNGASMFSGCTALSGSVVYNSSYIAWDMANTKTGYFTAKPELTTNMLMSGTKFNSIIPSNATSVIFTDAVADGATTTDLSALGDGSVVGWTSGTTYYVATVDGSKVIAHPIMTRAFYNKTSLTTVDFTNLDTSKVVNASHMFYGCSALQTFDASLLDTSNVKNMGYMFYSCTKLKTVDLNVLNTSNVLEMSYMFYNSGFETLNLKDWDVSSLVQAQYTFGNMTSLTHLDLSNWVLPTTIKNTSYMFYGCSKLYYIYAGDWGSQTYSGLSSNNMFYNVGAATELSSKNISIANTTTGCFATYSTEANVLMRGHAFSQYIPSAATSVVFDSTLAVPTDISLIDLSEARDGSVVGWLDGTTFYVSTVDNGTLYLNADSSKMFYEKSKLVTVDMGNADASKVTNMSYMFYYCSSLTTVDAMGLDVSNVTNMSNMFASCTKLTDCAISDWDVSSVTDMSYMFSYCYQLQNFDISDWNVSNVEKFDYMFYYCQAITTLDLSGWTPTSAKTTTCMFYSCTNLVTIYAQDWTPMTTPTNSSSMFYCQKVVGAVSYNGSYSNWSMANTTTGYFTTPIAETSEEVVETVSDEEETVTETEGE